jgi:hypothetical protein
VAGHEKGYLSLSQDSPCKVRPADVSFGGSSEPWVRAVPLPVLTYVQEEMLCTEHQLASPWEGGGVLLGA